LEGTGMSLHLVELGVLTSTTMCRRYLQILFLLLLTATACQAVAVQPIACGKEWINIHQKNPDLFGVYVKQAPDNKADAAVYLGKHPAMIIYVFKNGKAHQVSYTPSGQIESGFWWDVPPDHWVHGHLDTDVKEAVPCAFWVRK
jgi:hypothetical protein